MKFEMKKVRYEDFDFAGFRKSCIESPEPTHLTSIEDLEVEKTPFALKDADGKLAFPYLESASAFSNMIVFYGAIILPSDTETPFPNFNEFKRMLFWLSTYVSWLLRDEINPEVAVRYCSKTLQEISGKLASVSPGKLSPEKIIVETAMSLEAVYQAECLIGNISKN